MRPDARLTPLTLALALLLVPHLGPSEGHAHRQAEESEVRLPRPTGQSPVGTVVWHWIDGERPDHLTADASHGFFVLAIDSPHSGRVPERVSDGIRRSA